MIVYVPGRMPRTAYRLGVPYQLLVHQQQQQQHYQATAPPSPPISPTTTSLFNGWPRTMPQDEEMLVQSAATAATIVVNGPSSPAHSDSDASNSSLELRTEHTQLQCRWLNCSRWFTSLKQLADHVGKMHSEPGPKGLFYCGWDGCQRGDRGFNARYKMLVHVRTHTNEKPHRCFQCSKSFSRAENLKIHARSHTGERPYVCPVEGCNKAYSNSSDRFKHSRTHAVDKPYACKIAGCPKRYTDPSSLRKHIKTYRHCVNNNNDNNKHQDKTHNNTLSTVVPKRIQHHSTPDKRSTTSPSSDSDKKNSSLESNTTSTSLCSISESPKTTSSTSFEEQQKLVEWNNMYNLQEHHRKESNISITSSLKISNLEHHQHQQQQQQQQQQRLFTRSPYEEYILPDHHLPVMKAPTPSYPIEMKPHLATTASPPDHPMAAIPRIGTQSTPIKSEDKAASGVDYRNIDSIVNSSNNSTPLKKEPASSTQLSSPSSYIAATTDIVRNSVIKRADAPMDHQPSTISQQESPTTTTTTMNTPVVKEECCCRHKCCKHAENDTLLEKTKILSELILNSPNPVFRHLLASMELHQYGLQNSWSSSTNNQQIENSSPNTCAQDLRAKSTEAMQIDMDQDLPLDLTINK